MKQADLFKHFDLKKTRKKYGRTQHGGVGSLHHRKEYRPLSTKKWIHLVLKSDKAYGKLSFLRSDHQVFIKKLLEVKARQFGVRIGDYANVGNHLHIKLRASSREGFQKFLKSVTAQIARRVTGAKRGKPFGRFWQGLAYTRILMSSLEELNLKGYIEANRREVVSKAERVRFLKSFNAWVYKERVKTRGELAPFASLSIRT